jgi:hypothetical protein
LVLACWLNLHQVAKEPNQAVGQNQKKAAHKFEEEGYGQFVELNSQAQVARFPELQVWS